MTRQNVHTSRYTYDAAALFTTSTYSAMDKYTFSPSAPRTFPALNIVVPSARSNTTRRERRGRDKEDEERGVLRDVLRDRIPVESKRVVEPANSSSSSFSSDAPSRSGSNRSARFGVANAFVTRGDFDFDFAALLRRAVARREEGEETHRSRRRASRRTASTDREARARPPRRRPRRPR